MKKLKQLLKILIVTVTVFAIVFGTFAAGVRYNVIKKFSPLANKYNYAYEVNDTIQVLAVGNSDLYSGLSPQIIYNNTGITSIDAAYPVTHPKEAYELTTNILKKQPSCKVLILETDMVYTNPGKSGIKRVMYLFGEFLIRLDLKENFSYLYKKRTYPPENNTFTHGYYYSDNISEEKDLIKGSMEPTDEVRDLPNESLKYIKKIKKLCDKNGIELIFLEIPSPASWNYAKHNAVTQLADELGVEFIDLNLETEGVTFDYPTDFRDNGNHLNYHGAVKVSNYMSEVLKSYGIKDTRGDEKYASYAKSVEKYLEEYSFESEDEQ